MEIAKYSTVRNALEGGRARANNRIDVKCPKIGFLFPKGKGFYDFTDKIGHKGRPDPPAPINPASPIIVIIRVVVD